MSFKRSLTLILASAVLLAGCSQLGLGGGNKKPKTPTIGKRVAVLTAEVGAEVDPALADVAVLLPPAAANDSWGQPGGNASKSMEHPALGTALGQVWSSSIAGSNPRERLGAAPVISGGKLYVVDTRANVIAFDAGTGNKLWSVGFGTDGKDGRSSVFGGGVSVEGSVLYVTNGLGDVAALDANNGKQIWKKRPGGPLRGAPAYGNGNIYVMSQDNQIFALNAANGNVEWNETAAVELAGVFGVGAPAIGQGTVVAGFSSGELNAYRYENGRALWGDALSRTSISTSVSSLSDIDASPVIDRGRVFAVGQGGRMVSLELVTGQRLWEINLAGISTPWIAGEWVFVMTDEAKLVCIARASGKVRWISQLQRYKSDKKKKGPISWSGPVLAGDRLILASSEGHLVNVNPGDGKVQSTTKSGSGYYLAPIVANSTLYTLDNGGRITAWR
jgi:outer membrane protein assembly factor BamB